ncbi:MAG: thiosulfate oxidation carrier protein SoxY [Dechloromonas sp.]|jgi:sulfur-oxidizing protein SoxY|uniref:thiosulfate oxidation carrier protein SoxY n=1 Tax=Dechloromonas sp. TaxID=1917218 RepID=UPI0011DB07CB|nr:thiosulfate oxidation carrier protein SoxY [Dechloromonas sp.]MBU3695446.1 thiosulfate oxidation carrier protein SoxY [Dechloromonas sp.]TEX49008.1 MAG: thiosulfate oxidation carrier protein SoxY [Rhodocyclaceae bacterium]TXI79205.1 MAG: thiosulfate oxidation carrier protein SoxY [Dechloromonas sp.]
MNNQRRNVLKSGSGAALLGMLAAAGIINPGMALADWNKAAFDAKSMADTLKALGVAGTTDSKDVQVTGPDIAENGAVVPVGVSSTLPNVSMVAILIEKNPNALSATFNLPEGTEANVQTRVKMGQTSNVYALVKSDGKFFMATKEIKVTLGGCGG